MVKSTIYKFHRDVSNKKNIHHFYGMLSRKMSIRQSLWSHPCKKLTVLMDMNGHVSHACRSVEIFPQIAAWKWIFMFKTTWIKKKIIHGLRWIPHKSNQKPPGFSGRFHFFSAFRECFWPPQSTHCIPAFNSDHSPQPQPSMRWSPSQSSPQKIEGKFSDQPTWTPDPRVKFQSFNPKKKETSTNSWKTQV